LKEHTYHLGCKVINCNFHGQNVSSPSKAFIKRITENLLLQAFLAITHESILKSKLLQQLGKENGLCYTVSNLLKIYLII